MRILTLGRLPEHEIGGLPLFTAGMAEAMTALGHDCRVVHPGRSLTQGTYAFPTYAAGDSNWPIKGRTANFRKAFAAARTVRDHVEEVDPDVLHVQYGGAMDLAVLPGLAKLGIPVVVTAHCGRSWAHLSHAPRLSARRLATASRVLVLTGDQRDLFLSAGMDPEHVHTVGTLIDDEFFRSPRRVRQNALGPRRCLYLGRIAPEKGLETVIQALQAMQPEERPRFMAVGPVDPSYEDRLLELATGLGSAFELQGPVHSVSQRIRLLDEAECLLHPTLSDVKPLVVLEAMARELPILASSLPGTSELLAGIGRTFAPGSVAGLRDHLQAMHRRSDYLGSADGAAGRPLALRSTPAAAAAETIRHFEACLVPVA